MSSFSALGQSVIDVNVVYIINSMYCANNPVYSILIIFGFGGF